MVGKYFINTRPKPAYGQQGLDWILGQEYSFGVFSTPHFTPVAPSLVELMVRMKRYKQTDALYRQLVVRTNHYKQTDVIL